MGLSLKSFSYIFVGHYIKIWRELTNRSEKTVMAMGDNMKRYSRNTMQ